MGKEKQFNTFADLANTWEQEGIREWHHQTGDFWGPIFKNLRDGGGWLHIDEIFDTGEDHRFSLKPATEEESWKRIRHSEVEIEEDPALLLFREVARVYQRAEPGVQVELNQLFDVHRIRERLEREIRAREAMQKDQENLNAQVERMLELEEPPPELPAVREINDWNSELENAWNAFKGHLAEPGPAQRVTVDALVRERKAQWIGMNKERREGYDT
jgi:hypothetical protein